MVAVTYMFDTDTSSYIIKRTHEAVLRRLRSTGLESTCISVITQSELLYGVEVAPRREKIEPFTQEYLRRIRIVPLTEDVSSHYAEIRAVLKKSGQIIGANDLFVAAHARSLGLTLVTNNVREFGRVPGLLVENWAAA